MIKSWFKIKRLEKEIEHQIQLMNIYRNNFVSILNTFKHIDKKLTALDNELFMIRAFLDNLGIEYRVEHDGTITFVSNFKYTKVGPDGDVHRWN